MSNVIFEFRVLGNVCKVSAICEETGIEVCVVTKASSPQQFQKHIALKKLQMLKFKKISDS